MEKQEAIDYILAEIARGRSEDEIATELSLQLRAPKEIVAGFVNRTLASQVAMGMNPLQPEQPGPAEETPAGPAPENLLTAESQEITTVERSEELTPTDDAFSEEGDHPDEPQLVDENILADQSEWVDETYTSEEVAADVLEHPSVESLQTDNIRPEEGGQLVEKTLQEEITPSPAPVWDPDALSKKSVEPLSPGDRARLEKAILSALSKQRRQSDVVMMVCERTGMSWDQAQRLVAEVSMKNRGKINKREGTIQILFSLLAVLAGLALIFAVLSEAYTFYRLYAQPEAVSPVIPVLDRYTIWGGMVGLLLFFGGIIGMVLGIRKRQE